MSSLTRAFDFGETHPIDIAEALAGASDWDFDRLTEDQIALAIRGTWGDYSVTLAWSAPDMTLRLICAFGFRAPSRRISAINALMCLANDMCWSGAFVLWQSERMLGYRYGLNLAGGSEACREQISSMISNAFGACERFYPAFQLVASGNTAEVAIGFAMDEAYGRA